MSVDRRTPPRYLPQAKAERLAAMTRLVLAAYSVLAGVATGMLRERPGVIAVLLLIVWSMLAAAVWQRTRSGRRIRVAAAFPILDLVLIAAVILTSGGAVSPFFPLVVLPFFAVSLVYGRRVIAWTGLVGIFAYLVVSFVTPQRTANPRLFIMRIGFLLIIGSSVLRRNEFDVRMRSDALKLAAWPQPAGRERDDFVRVLLGHAADLLRAPRVLLAWEEIGGMRQLALWSCGSMEWLEPPRGGDRALVAPPLAGMSFLSRDAASASPEGLCFDGRKFSGHRGALLDSGTVERFGIRSVISVCFNEEMVEGRLFLLDTRDADSDDLTLAEVVARLLGSELEQANLLERLRRTTAMEERMRMSRDLHDTLMQSMAGVALQVEGARRLMASDAAVAEERLAAAAAQLAESQSSLRAFVDDLRPELSPHHESLRMRFGSIASMVTRRWGLTARVDSAEDLALPEPLGTEVCHLVAEALTNAARHATASRVEARVTTAAGQVNIEIEDDGRGFPFHGSYDLGELVSLRRGPWSLKERVLSLHGAMTLVSSPTGSRIAIRLPVVRVW